MIEKYIFHITFAILILILIRFRIIIANSFNIMDHPDNCRKMHLSPIPSVGGLIILPYIFGSLIEMNLASLISTKLLSIWLFLLFVFFSVGLIDDIKHLGAKTKTFLLLILLFLVLPLDQQLLIKALQFQDLSYVIILNQGALFFTIFCIYFFYNALNFSDGANGITSGLCIYWIIALILISGTTNTLYFSILISLFLILMLNLQNKIFIGNSGANFLSILFSLIFIQMFNAKQIFFDQIVLLLFLPSMDLVRIVIERLLNGKSPSKADRNHFHHLLCGVVHSKYVFIPYLIFAIMPYFLKTLYLKSYVIISFSIVAYFIILFFLKNKNA